MKNIYLILLTIIFGIFFAFKFTEALLVRPLGGMILVAPIPGMTCPSSTTPGPWTIRPYTIASPGPYLILTSGTKHIPRPGVYFKGNYILTPVPICNTGNSPTPTFVIEGLIYQSTQ